MCDNAVYVLITFGITITLEIQRYVITSQQYIPVLVLSGLLAIPALLGCVFRSGLFHFAHLGIGTPLFGTLDSQWLI